MLQYAAVHPAGTTGITLGGGGGGRLLLGRGIGHVWSVRAGPEFGVVALVERNNNSTALPLQFVAAVPLVIRYNDISWHYNLEAAPLAMLTEKELAEKRPARLVRYGARVCVMIGISALQVRSFIPWAAAWGAAEIFPEAGDRSMLLNLKGGVRAGVDWDF
jgi:hypothetical protein